MRSMDFSIRVGLQLSLVLGESWDGMNWIIIVFYQFTRRNWMLRGWLVEWEKLAYEDGLDVPERTRKVQRE